MRQRLAAAVLLLLVGCSAAEAKGALHKVSTPAAGASGATVGATIGGPWGAAIGALVATVTAELVVPTGKAEAVQEAVDETTRAMLQAMVDERMVAEDGPLAELHAGLRTADEAVSLIDQLEGLVWTIVKIAAAVIGLHVAYTLWRRYQGGKAFKWAREAKELLGQSGQSRESE